MKILVSDYDGTLNFGGGVCEREKEALARWKAAGNLFGVATGRDIENALNGVHKSELIYDFMICASGGITLDANDNVIRASRISGEILPDIYKLMLEMKGAFMSVTVDAKKHVVDMKGTGEEGMIKPEDLGKIKIFNQFNVCFEDPEDTKPFCEEINKRFSEHVTAHVSGCWADVPGAGDGNGKASAIYHYIRSVGAKKEDVITVGDNYNDMEMVEEFGGCAMLNGVPELKAAAKGGVFETVAELINFYIDK